MNVAHTDMTIDQVVENIQSAVSIISEAVPGEWGNIKAFHLRTRKSISLPIYTSLFNKSWKVDEIVTPKLSNEDIENCELNSKGNFIGLYNNNKVELEEFVKSI